MIVMLASAKGSPGVTTTSLALTAAVAGSAMPASVGDALLMEADPAGGDLECWCGPHGDPGLLKAVTEVRQPEDVEPIRAAAVSVVPGVNALLAPTSDTSMAAALRSCSAGFPGAVAQLGATVVVDRGRWLPDGHRPLDELARQASLVVVCRPALASVEHARALVSTLRPLTSRVGVAVVGGSKPYSPSEIAAAVGAHVLGVLPWDPRGVATLVERGVTKSWLRSSLGQAAQQLSHGVVWLAGASQMDLAHG
jgi:MinD-like ATPase involved in chromosome partitioning or flagellar assembly